MKQNAIINRHNKQGDVQSDIVSKFTELLSREVGTMNKTVKTDNDVVVELWKGSSPQLIE